MIKILNFRKYERNTLRGFFEVELASGMCLRDLSLHEKNGSQWVGYPSRQYEGEDGKTKYMNQVYFADKAINKKFQSLLLAALDTYFSNQR